MSEHTLTETEARRTNGDPTTTPARPAAVRPPMFTTTTFPSTSGEHAIPKYPLSDARSFRVSTVQICLPSASARHASIPSAPSV